MPKRRLVAAAVAVALGVPLSEIHAQSVAPTIGTSALPSGGRVVGGQATISQSGAAMQIQQGSARAALDWQSFSIGSQASVTFNQPSASAIALNRVLGASGSEIYGRLSANGQVFLINPNGVLFARGSQVDVGGIVASTLWMSPDDFMSGRNQLRNAGNAGTVTNEGHIKGRSVVLVGPRVVNDGLIEAPSGAINLTAANAATLDFMADGLIQIRVDEGAIAAEVANSGTLRADGGSVTLTAKSLDNLARSVVNNTGIIEARTVQNVNGVVRLGGDDVLMAGTIDAHGAEGKGGSVKLIGERVGLTDSARIDASGDTGGGEVLIGGNYQGKGPEQNAIATYVGRDVTIDASAGTRGDGGKVIVWADNATRFYGSIKTTGGAQGGDGGFVETSGKAWLDYQGQVDTRAVFGRTGTLLLDPTDITISAATTSNGTCILSLCFTLIPAVASAVLNITDLTNALTGTNVTVSTSNVGGGNGDISVNTAINYNSTNSLSFIANRDIRLTNGSAVTNAGAGAISFSAPREFRADASLSSGGAVNITAQDARFTNGTTNVSGTYNVSNSTSVSGANVTFGGTVTSVGALDVSGGTAAFGAQNVTVPTYSQSGGTLSGSGNLTVSGATTLSGGGIMSGAGSTITQGSLSITGSVGLDAGRTLDVRNGADWTAGSINLNASTGAGSGKIINAAVSTFSTDFSGSISASNFGAGDNGSTALFDNQGAFEKRTGPAGTTSISTMFNNGGSVLARNGTLSLSGGGTSSGSFTGSATLQFGGGTHTLTGTSSITAGDVTFSAGTADVGGTYNVSGTTTVSGGTAKFTGTLTSLGNALIINSGTADVATASASVSSFTQSGGTLSGSGNLTVSGATALSGGTMSGAGSTITQGSLTINGSGTNLDAGRVLDVQGNTTWSAGNINLNSNSVPGSGTIINRVGSTFTTSFDGSIFTQNFGAGDNGTSARFDNLGTFRKTGSTGITSVSSVFNDTGSVNVQSGTVNLSGGGTHTGGFSGSGTIQFGGGTHTLTTSSTVTTANGTFSAGTADVGGTYNVSGTTLVNGGTANFTGTVTSLGAALNITSGTADVGTTNATVSTFTQSDGTLSGSGNLTVNGATTLSGGTMTGSGSTIARGALAISSSGTNLDAGRVLDVQGGATWSAGNINLNSNSVPGSGKIINRATSTFTTTFDGSMFTQNFGGSDNGTTALFDNLGTFTKTGLAATTAISNAFNNTGTLNVQSGTVNLSGGGTHSGSFTGAGTIQFGGGTHTLTGTSSVTTANGTFSAGTANVGGTYNISGTSTVNGGTANFTGTLTSLGGALIITAGIADVGTANATVSSFTQSGGTLSGSGNLTVSGTTTLSGGTMSGPGSTITQGALTINVSGTNLDAGRILDVQGGATWTAGNINLNSNSVVGSGTIINRAGSTFTNTFDGSMFTQNFGAGDNGGTALFDNQGTFAKTGLAGTTSISTAFNNSGALNVQSGIVNLTGGGTHSGSFSTGVGTTLQFGGGTHDVNNASAVNSLGRLLFTGGTVNTTGTLTSGGLIELTGSLLNAGGAINTSTYTQSGGTLAGGGNLTVSGATILSGGTMTGPGSTITQGALTINVSGTNLDAGRILDVQGGATWTAGNINLNSNSVVGSGTIINRPGSTFTNTFDGSMFTQNFGGSDNGASALFDNRGTFAKTGLAGTTTISNAVNNTGALNVQSGIVNLTGGGTHSGSFSTAVGTTLQFGGGTHDVNNASAVNSLGRLLFTGGTVNTTGTLASGGLIELTGSLLNAGGAIDTVTYSQSGGTLSGSGNLTVSGATILSGGTMTGPGSTITQGALTINVSGTNLDGGRVLDVQGGATWTAGNINLNSNSVPGSGTIINRAGSTFTNTFDGSIFTQNFGGSDNGASALFDNRGTFAKTGLVGTTTVSSAFDNTGALNVQSGTVNLTGGGTHSGSFSTVAGTTLQFGGGTHEVNNASAVNSLGRLLFSSGTVNTTGTLTSGGLIELTGSLLNAGGAIDTVTYSQSGGTLSGSGNLTVSGATALSGGLMTGGGSTITQGALTISGGGIGLDANRVLDIQGGATWTAGNINLNANSGTGSGTVVNRAGSTFSNTFDGNMFTQNFGGADTGTSALFDNQGTFVKSAGVNSTFIQNAFNNSGTLNVQSGTVALTAGGTHSGGFSTVAGTTLQFAGGTHDLNNASAVNSLGRLLFSSGTVNTTGTMASGGLIELTGSTLNAGGPIDTVTYTQSGGTLGGTGNLTVSGATTLLGGVMSGSGSTITQGPLTIASSGIGLDAGRVLDIQGGAAWTGGSINLNANSAVGSGTLINRPSSTITQSFDGNMFTQNFGGSDNGSSALFDNQGVFQKTAGLSTSTISNALSNNGAIVVQSGALNVTNFPTNAGKILLANNTTFATNGNSLTNAAGSGLIEGVGTLSLGSGTLGNNGTVRAGGQAAVGTLAISGNYAQGASGVLDVDLQSATVHDVLAVSGSATLGGTLNVNYLGGYTGFGNDHTVMTYASRTGNFATINDVNALTALYDPTALVLSAQVLNIWINAGSGDWSLGTNWSLGHEPSAAEEARVPELTGAQTISVLSAGHTPKSVVFLGDETLSLTGGSLMFTSASTINNGSLVLSGGTLTANAPLSVRNLDLASGTLNGSGSVNVTNAYSQSAGVMNIAGAAQITQASGALNLGAITASAINATALAGGITQSGLLTTPVLQTSSVNGQILDLGNAVGTFNAVNTGSGNVALTNTVPLTVTNITAAGGGSVLLNNSAPVTVTGVVLGGPVTVSATGTIHLAVGGSIGVNGNNASSITLNAGGGSSDIVLGGDLFASPGPIALRAAGSIRQVAGVIDTVGTLTGSAGGSVSLGMDNTISNLGTFTANGTFLLHEHLSSGLTVTGSVSTGGAGLVKITNATGPISLTGGGSISGQGVSLGATSVSVAANVDGGGSPVAVIAMGAIDLQARIQTADASANAVVLSAGDGTAAGTASGGDVTITGGGAIKVGSGGRATIFTGSVAGSNVSRLVAAGSGNFRYHSNPSSAGYTAPLGSGTYAIYREQPTLAITAVGPSSMVYGSGVPAYTSTVSGLVNGDTAAQALAAAATVADDRVVSTSGNLTAANHVLTPSGAVDQLGYGIAYATGTLTIAKATVSNVTGFAANNKVYDGTVNATLDSSAAVFVGKVAGDVLTVGSATAVFNNRNVGAGKPVSVTSIALGGADAGNYTPPATTASTTGAITPRPLVVSGAPDTKVYDGNTISAALASVSGLVGGDTASFSQAYDTKDVGAGKTMTPMGGVVSDGNGGANYTVSFAGSPVGVITQLSSVSWTGGGGNNFWSNPANWAGNAIPDRANVANVDLAGAAVVFDAAVPSLGNQVSVRNVSGGTLSANGGSLMLAVASNASLSGYSQASGTTAIGRDLSITSPGASITQTGGTLIVGGSTLLNAGANSIALPSPSNSFGGAVTASATGGINIVTGGVLIPGTINAGTGTVTLTAGGIGAGGPISARDATLSSNAPVNNLQVAVTDSLVFNGSAPTWRILDSSSPAGFTTLEFATLFENGLCITGPLCGITIGELTGFTPQAVINSLPTNTTPYAPTIPDTAVAMATAIAPYQVASVASTPVPLPSGLPRFPITPSVQLLMDDMEQMRSRKKQALEDAVKILERDPSVADLKSCVGDEVSGTCIAQRPKKPRAEEAAPAPAEAALPAIHKKVALLIGVNDYRGSIPKLDSPLKDIEDIAKLYREQFGYEVRTLADADKASIVRELNRLILESSPNDSVTVFYAGHGQLIEKTGRGYWIPAKASADNPAEWISNSDIGRALEAISAKQLLLVSDSCYSGTLTRDAKVEKGEVLSDPAQVLAKRAVTVLTSGGEEPVADAGKDGHSVFAWHFMKTLQTVTNWSGGVDVYQQLAGAVQQDFPQEPQYGASTAAGHERGADFLFEVRKY